LFLYLYTIKVYFKKFKFNKMDKRRRVLLAVLLMISVGNYFRIDGNESIRLIQFLSIFAIGMLSGLILREVINFFKNQEK
jgi:hypothetical protein